MIANNHYLTVRRFVQKDGIPESGSSDSIQQFDVGWLGRGGNYE
ncbi:MAG TPA: hypothetical protein VNK26_03890 [Pyrinomonadaceae bacterium]|nr:hypothetical protein [Pyrinomonadaceae bacterium]